MVSIDAITEKPALAKMVIPEDNTFDNNNSIFHFRLKAITIFTILYVVYFNQNPGI